jgi:uncharacterized membrane protein
MDASTYWKYQIITAGVMGFLFAMGFQQDNMILVASAFIIGISSLIYLRKKAVKPLYDERSSLISTKASAASFSTFTIGSLVIAAIFFYLGNTVNPEYFQWAYSLAWIVCGNMLLRLFFWIYYARKYGG